MSLQILRLQILNPSAPVCKTCGHVCMCGGVHPCPACEDRAKVVELSPNARARDAAVALLREALSYWNGPAVGWSTAPQRIRDALVCLEAIK